MAIGCVKTKPIPGTRSFSRSSISSCSSSLERPDLHAERGLSITKTSAWCSPMGSLPISARPTRLTTVLTSGDMRSVCSISVCIATERVSDTLGSRSAWITIEPSSSSGRNSVPSAGTSSSAPAKSAAAEASVAFGRVIARPRSGRYRRSSQPESRTA